MKTLLARLFSPDHAEVNYMQMVHCLGQLEERLSRLATIFEAFDPVWPRHRRWTTDLMRRIAETLVPEIKENDVARSEVTRLTSLCYNNIPRRKIKFDPKLLNHELMVLVYLTMMGFQFPISQPYSSERDSEKAWARELMLRLIKCHSPEKKKEFRYLVPLENQVSAFLQERFP